MAKLYGQIQSIQDGMVTWQDVFSEAPADDDEGEATTDTQPRGTPQAQPVGESPKVAPKEDAPAPATDPPPPADGEQSGIAFE